jgi:hypothetical protein
LEVENERGCAAQNESEDEVEVEDEDERGCAAQNESEDENEVEGEVGG